MRRALGIAVVVLAIVPAGEAAAVVVPQRGMMGLTLGMTVAQVRDRAGPPDAIAFVDNEIIGRQRIYRYGRTRVVFNGARRNARVLSLHTTSRRERLANGVGVGSTRETVRRRVRNVTCRVDFGIDHCFIGHFRAGRRVTDFLINRRGRVHRITVGIVVD